MSNARVQSTRTIFVRFDVLLRYLIPSSLLYLALPHVIFFVGWTKWYFGLGYAALIAAGLYFCWRETDRIIGKAWTDTEPLGLKLQHVLVLFLLALVLMSISGVGGYGYQDGDWLKHNAILKSLIEQPWPVTREVDGTGVSLVYYVAFYLPAALLGKLGGWSLANQALFAWAFVGLILAMLWFLVLARRAAYVALALFTFFSGLDVLGKLFVAPAIVALRPEFRLATWEHIDEWAVAWQYSSNATLLFWVPNQALAGWIVAGLVIYSIRHSSPKENALFYLGLVSLWSPFVALGVLPYLLADFLTDKGALSKRLRAYISAPNVCGLALVAACGLYYSAKFYEMPLSSSAMSFGFVWTFCKNTLEMIVVPIFILLFCLLEFGAYAIVIHSARPGWDLKTKGLLVATIACLALLPFYRLGTFNDFVMRTSIPALFCLAVLLAQTLCNNALTGFRRALLILFILAGAVTPLIEYRRHVTNMHNARILQAKEYEQVSNLWELGDEYPEYDLYIQYLGSLESPFFKYIARQPQDG